MCAFACSDREVNVFIAFMFAFLVSEMCALFAESCSGNAGGTAVAYTLFTNNMRCCEVHRCRVPPCSLNFYGIPAGLLLLVHGDSRRRWCHPPRILFIYLCDKDFVAKTLSPAL